MLSLLQLASGAETTTTTTTVTTTSSTTTTDMPWGAASLSFIQVGCGLLSSQLLAGISCFALFLALFFVLL